MTTVRVHSRTCGVVPTVDTGPGDHRPCVSRYTIYVVNPSAATLDESVLPQPGSDTNQNTTSTDEGDATDEPTIAPPLPGYWYRSTYFHDGCAAPMWQSVVHRLAWVDVAAGEPHWGPRSAGDGAVTPLSVPRLRMATKESVGGGIVTGWRPTYDVVPTSMFVARLAAFLHSTTRRLLAPPLYSYPFPDEYRRAIRVRCCLCLCLVHQHGTPWS